MSLVADTLSSLLKIPTSTFSNWRARIIHLVSTQNFPKN